MSSYEKIPVDKLTLGMAVANIRNLLKNPDNKAAQALARISANTLEGYLPTAKEQEKKET